MYGIQCSSPETTVEKDREKTTGFYPYSIPQKNGKQIAKEGHVPKESEKAPG